MEVLAIVYQFPEAVANFIKKETLAQMFSCEFYEIFKNTFFYRTPLVAASKFVTDYSPRLPVLWNPR